MKCSVSVVTLHIAAYKLFHRIQHYIYMKIAGSFIRFNFVLDMINHDRPCGLVIRVPGYTTEMYCDSCEVRTEFICYVEESRPPLRSSGQSSWLQVDVLFPVKYELNL
jgi:hypothetical protein